LKLVEVTAGNSSQMSDGAAFVPHERRNGKELNLEPIARLVNFASAGVEPRIMGIDQKQFQSIETSWFIHQ
jgi:acetyl-CoA acyltransferase